MSTIKWVIQKPNLYEEKFISGLVDLINAGGEVDTNVDRLLRADVIVVAFDDDKIACTATLKNPNDNYKRDVFTSAGIADQYQSFDKEIGYIVTTQEYEGQKLCQHAMKLLIPVMSKHNIFATTRKPIMAHILTKFGFVKTGKEYKKDLALYCLKASL